MTQKATNLLHKPLNADEVNLVLLGVFRLMGLNKITCGPEMYVFTPDIVRNIADHLTDALNARMR